MEGRWIAAAPNDGAVLTGIVEFIVGLPIADGGVVRELQVGDGWVFRLRAVG